MHDFAYCALANVLDPRKLKGKIIIRVGTGDDQKLYQVERSIWGNSSSSRPPAEIQLPSDDPTTVEMFIDWAKRPRSPIVYVPGDYSEEPWISHAVGAWKLGGCLGSDMFQKYALSQFIQNCALTIHGPWKLIEKKAPRNSSLFRFSTHWVAWNVHISGCVTDQYTNLKATELADQIGAAMSDPRTFELDHWY